jgi:hypothetical protein
MAEITIGGTFPEAVLQDTDGQTVEFPAAFSKAAATVIFFYRGRW